MGGCDVCMVTVGFSATPFHHHFDRGVDPFLLRPKILGKMTCGPQSVNLVLALSNLSVVVSFMIQ